MTLAGVDVVDYHEPRCEHMMADFIEKQSGALERRHRRVRQP